MTMDREVYAENFARPIAATRYTHEQIEEAAGHKLIAYSYIPEARIPAGHVQFVRRHLARLLREAGLPPVRLLWFGPAVGTPDFYSPRWLGGMTSRDVGIALLAMARGPKLLNHIAHEVAHLTDPPELSFSECEARATAIGDAYERRMTG